MEGRIAESARRFETSGTAAVVRGNGGLPIVRITSPEVVVQMYLHSAHVTSWRPAGGEEVIRLSSQPRWDDGHAIRGGVPVCFPWFGGNADDPQAPANRLVRTKAWQLGSIAQLGGAVTVSMSTESNEATKGWWPAEFRLVHRDTFGTHTTDGQGLGKASRVARRVATRGNAATRERCCVAVADCRDNCAGVRSQGDTPAIATGLHPGTRRNDGGHRKDTGMRELCKGS
jgi:Aldose 1-epimerase